jgi:hypothetical protein
MVSAAPDLPAAFASRHPVSTSTAGEVEYEFAETALGPFGSVFGGILAGVLVDHARSAAPSESQFASASFDFLRPSSPGPVEISSQLHQQGRRMVLIGVSMSQGGKMVAEARVIFTQSIDVANLPRTAPPSWSGLDPRSLPEPRRPRLPTAWSGDLLEVRVDERTGIRWFRRLNTELMPLSPPAFAVAVSDYAAGMSRPDSWEAPLVRAFPNPNLFVSLVREPQGDWVGLRAQSVWDGSGVGLSHAELIDREGFCGFVEMVCLLVPHGGSDSSRAK